VKSHYKTLGYCLAAIILTLAILGGRLQSIPIVYTMLGLICFAVALVAFDKIPEKVYPYLIFSISLGLLYHVTLISPYLVGTDIHYEYYYAHLTFENGYWDYNLPYTYNAAMSVSVFVPYLAKLFHVDIEWIFKVVCPLFLAFIPVIMYLMFKKFIGNKPAFLSVFFFMSVPTFFLELTGIAKQEVGEFFLVLCLFMFVNTDTRLKTSYQMLAIFSLAILAAVSHYVMGATVVYYLLGAIPILLILRHVTKAQVKTSLKYLALTILAIVVFVVPFYGLVAGGVPLHEITGRITSQAEHLTSSPTPDTTGIAPIGKFSWTQHEPTMKVALGLDFMEVDTPGKIFRILQYITQLLLIIGGIYLLLNWRKYSPEYLALFCLSGGLIILCIFAPGFTRILNATRFYHLALIFSAPAIILGGKLVLRNYKILTLCILIPYFMFTSGLIFEATQQDDVSKVNIPYSLSLSATRVDVTGIYTKNDGIVRDWIVEHDKAPLSTDMWGGSFMAEKIGDFGVKSGLYYFRIGNIGDSIRTYHYIFMRERNEILQEITFYTGIGLRQTMSYAEAGIYEALEGREVIFQSGQAKVYGPKK